MKKLVLALLLVSSMGFSQNNIVTRLGDFKTLKVFSGLKVELIRGDVSKVVVSGKKADQVSIKNKNGLLKLSLKFTDGFTYDDIKIELFYSAPIAILDANEGGYIISEEKVQQQHLEVKVQEGAHINLPVEIKYLTVKTISGGVVDLFGSAQNQTVDANTGGLYHGYDLVTKQTTTTSASGAVVKVNVTEMLDAKVNLGGTVYYTGNPEELKTKKVMGGKIKSKD